MKTIRTTRKSRRFTIGGFLAAVALLLGVFTFDQQSIQPQVNRAQQAYYQQLGNQPGYNALGSGNQPSFNELGSHPAGQVVAVNKGNQPEGSTDPNATIFTLE